MFCSAVRYYDIISTIRVIRVAAERAARLSDAEQLPAVAGHPIHQKFIANLAHMDDAKKKKKQSRTRHRPSPAVRHTDVRFNFKSSPNVHSHLVRS